MGFPLMMLVATAGLKAIPSVDHRGRRDRRRDRLDAGPAGDPADADAAARAGHGHQGDRGLQPVLPVLRARAVGQDDQHRDLVVLRVRHVEGSRAVRGRRRRSTC